MASRTRALASHVIAAAATPAVQDGPEVPEDIARHAVLGGREGKWTSEDMIRAVSRGCEEYAELLERNWNGNVRFNGTPAVPASLSELQAVVRDAAAPVRVVGRGHSFTPLAECAGGTLLSLARLSRVLDFQEPKEGQLGAITFEGGATYTELARFMGRRGALRNLPSSPGFTVAGAIATATHGSGIHLQNLAADVAAIEFVKADGSTVHYCRKDNPQVLEGCRVHLGCLGVVSQLTLDVVPFYEVQTYFYTGVPLQPVIDALPDLWTRCDSLSIYSRGFGRGPEAGTCMAMFRHFLPHWEPALGAPGHDRPEALAGGELVDTPSLIRFYAEQHCLEPLMWLPTSKRSWFDGLTLTADGGEETPMIRTDIQAEFFVPLSCAQAAIHAVWDATRDLTFGVDQAADGQLLRLLVDAMELREVKGDGAWLSPHPVDSLGIHFSFNGMPQHLPEVHRAVALIERALEPFGPRAHWGKLAPLTFAPARTRALYGEGLQLFRALCMAHDPQGKFRNAHVQHMLFTD